ncbi:MAG: endolytic transglycosylase MltG, partial [Armatimonadota bacterium]
MKRILAVTRAYIVLLLTLFAGCVWMMVLGSRPVSDDRAPVRVYITRGASAREIAGILSDRGLIRSPFVFLFTCRISGNTGTLKPGVYELNRAMSVPAIIRALVRGESLQAWITIPEGYTARQIADVLEERGIADSEAFLRMALTQGNEFPRYPFVYGDCLEGYLFPDSYLIARDAGPAGVIAKMLDAFERKVVVRHREDIQQAAGRQFGLGRDAFAEGLHRLLTVASMVEREARIAKDRPLVAAVIYNRLKRGMKLEVDATVTYSPGDSRGNKDRIYYDDLNNDSSYNT